MAAKPTIHTIPVRGGWANEVEGAKRPGPKFATKKEAEAAGRARAQRDKTEHICHRKDGSIGERRSHGNDPHPPAG